jgi:hypothetical protein
MSILKILALSFAVSMTMIGSATAQTSPGAIQPNTFPDIFPGPQLSPLSYCSPGVISPCRTPNFEVPSGSATQPSIFPELSLHPPHRPHPPRRQPA